MICSSSPGPRAARLWGLSGLAALAAPDALAHGVAEGDAGYIQETFDPLRYHSPTSAPSTW